MEYSPHEYKPIPSDVHCRICYGQKKKRTEQEIQTIISVTNNGSMWTTLIKRQLPSYELQTAGIS